MLVVILRLVSWLPLAWVHALGRLGGRLAYRFAASYRQRLQAYLIQAQTHDPQLNTVSFASAAAAAGEFASELPWVWFRRRSEVVKAIVCDDVEVLDQAEATGRGIVFLTPHLGCFEATAMFYASRRPITVLFKPPKQAALARTLEVARGGENLFTAPATFGGVRQMLKALRKGQAVGLLPDQVPSEGEGQWAEFYGRAAYTMGLPLKLVQASGAVVVLAVGERLGRGRGWRLHLQEMTDEPTPAAVNLAMQRLIRKCPEQYLWAYNRYKRPANAQAAPQATPPKASV
jgi:Kdo2-lipid IVA lauroyltransferase/acyltransferase